MYIENPRNLFTNNGKHFSGTSANGLDVVYTLAFENNANNNNSTLVVGKYSSTDQINFKYDGVLNLEIPYRFPCADIRFVNTIFKEPMITPTQTSFYNPGIVQTSNGVTIANLSTTQNFEVNILRSQIPEILNLGVKRSFVKINQNLNINPKIFMINDTQGSISAINDFSNSDYDILVISLSSVCTLQGPIAGINLIYGLTHLNFSWAVPIVLKFRVGRLGPTLGGKIAPASFCYPISPVQTVGPTGSDGKFNKALSGAETAELWNYKYIRTRTTRVTTPQTFTTSVPFLYGCLVDTTVDKDSNMARTSAIIGKCQNPDIEGSDFEQENYGSLVNLATPNYFVPTRVSLPNRRSNTVTVDNTTVAYDNINNFIAVVDVNNVNQALEVQVLYFNANFSFIASHYFQGFDGYVIYKNGCFYLGIKHFFNTQYDGKQNYYSLFKVDNSILQTYKDGNSVKQVPIPLSSVGNAAQIQPLYTELNSIISSPQGINLSTESSSIAIPNGFSSNVIKSINNYSLDKSWSFIPKFRDNALTSFQIPLQHIYLYVNYMSPLKGHVITFNRVLDKGNPTYDSKGIHVQLSKYNYKGFDNYVINQLPTNFGAFILDYDNLNSVENDSNGAVYNLGVVNKQVTIEKINSSEIVLGEITGFFSDTVGSTSTNSAGDPCISISLKFQDCSGLYSENPISLSYWDPNLKGIPLDEELNLARFHFKLGGDFVSFQNNYATKGGYFAVMTEKPKITLLYLGEDIVDTIENPRIERYNQSGIFDLILPLKIKAVKDGDGREFSSDPGYALSGIAFDLKLSDTYSFPAITGVGTFDLTSESEDGSITPQSLKTIDEASFDISVDQDITSSTYTVLKNIKYNFYNKTGFLQTTLSQSRYDTTPYTLRFDTTLSKQGQYVYGQYESWLLNKISIAKTTEPVTYVKGHRYSIEDVAITLDGVDKTQEIGGTDSTVYLYLTEDATVSVGIDYSLIHEDWYSMKTDTDTYPHISNIYVFATRPLSLDKSKYYSPVEALSTTYPTNNEQLGSFLFDLWVEKSISESDSAAVIAGTTNVNAGDYPLSLTLSNGKWQIYMIVEDEFGQYSCFCLTNVNKNFAIPYRGI